MKKGKKSRNSRFYWYIGAGVLLILLVAYWLLPIQGKILILTDSSQEYIGSWPRIKVDPPAAKAGESVTLSLSDTTRWQEVKLLVGGNEAQFLGETVELDSVITWKWHINFPAQGSYGAVFYHNCKTGCVENARFELGSRPSTSATATTFSPTKLGVVFADSTRDWHGRAGWNIELLYALQPDNSDFGVDNVATRVLKSNQNGLRTLVRIAYDQGQALPPAGDEAALKRYMEFCVRVARDARFGGVYGYIIGSGFNRKNENSLAPDHLVTPEWYARLFNGYGLNPARHDNVLEAIRLENPQVRVLVGSVTPWSSEQSGAIANSIDVPWLNYMNTLVAHLDETAQAKQEAGIALAAPDGFSVQAPGRTEPALVRGDLAQEPALDLYQSPWGSAQMGFRVYQNWQDIINRYPTSRGLPIYITSTNTFTSDTQIDPAQNYPVGWLTTAFNEINREPQIQALCWFVDNPYDKWSNFSLKARLGKMNEGSLEFDRLLTK